MSATENPARRGPLLTVMALVPGTLPTFVSPLLLFRALPAAQYAQLEAVVMSASLLAIAIGGGRSIRLPHDCLECGRKDAPARLWRVIVRWSCGLLALSLLPRIGAAAADLPCAAWCWLSLLLAMTACFLLQTFIATTLKVQTRPALSAFAEHAVWHVWMVLVLLAMARQLAIDPGLLHTVVALHTGLLLSLSRAVLPDHGATVQASPQGAWPETPAWPLMLGQFATVGGLALARLVLLACGQPEAAAQAALAFRLALPVIFVAQAMNLAGWSELFSAQPTRKAAAIARLTLRVGLFCGAWPLLLLGINAWAGHSYFPSSAGFAACLVLAVSTTASLTTRNIASTAAMTDGLVWRRTAELLAMLPLAAMGTTAIALGGFPASPLRGMFAGWLMLAGVCNVQIGRLAPAARGTLRAHAATVAMASLAAALLD